MEPDDNLDTAPIGFVGEIRRFGWTVSKECQSSCGGFGGDSGLWGVREGEGDSGEREGESGFRVGDKGAVSEDSAVRATPVMTPTEADGPEGTDIKSAKPPPCGRLAFFVRRAPFIKIKIWETVNS